MTSSASTPQAAPVAPSLPAPVSSAPPRRPATGAGPGRAHLSRVRRVWAETWRLGLATLVGLLAFGLVWPETSTAGWSDARLGLSILGDLAAGVSALVLVAFRHRAPFVIALILAACGGVSTLATGGLKGYSVGNVISSLKCPP